MADGGDIEESFAQYGVRSMIFDPQQYNIDDVLTVWLSGVHYTTVTSITIVPISNCSARIIVIGT